MADVRIKKKRSWKQRELKPTDLILRPDEAQETDIVIPYVYIYYLVTSASYCCFQGYGSNRCRKKHCRQFSTNINVFFFTQLDGDSSSTLSWGPIR
jgi:hypothetical protein